VRNRKEWEAKGREIVDEMVEKMNRMQWSAATKPETALPKRDAV